MKARPISFENERCDDGASTLVFPCNLFYKWLSWKRLLRLWFDFYDTLLSHWYNGFLKLIDLLFAFLMFKVVWQHGNFTFIWHHPHFRSPWGLVFHINSLWLTCSPLLIAWHIKITVSIEAHFCSFGSSLSCTSLFLPDQMSFRIWLPCELARVESWLEVRLILILILVWWLQGFIMFSLILSNRRHHIMQALIRMVIEFLKFLDRALFLLNFIFVIDVFIPIHLKEILYVLLVLLVLLLDLFLQVEIWL